VSDRIETLVAQLGNVEVVTYARETECCGFGGTFAIKQPDISGAMVKDKTDALRATRATRVISQDCGCLMNIGGAFARQAGRLGECPEFQHIAEFLWERTA
jgi:L-lactate dehydrogenase complex protein LldE